MTGRFFLAILFGAALMFWWAGSEAMTVYICHGGASPIYQDVPCGKEAPLGPPRDKPVTWGDPVTYRAYQSFNGDAVYTQRQEGAFGSHRTQVYSNGQLVRQMEWK